jgi:hypothetical protein
MKAFSFDSPKNKSFGGLREGILWIWWLQICVLFLSGTSKLRKKKGRGIYTPSQNVAVAALRGVDIPG